MQQFVMKQWQKEPVWISLAGFGLVVGILYLIGPGGQQTVVATIQNIGRDPVATGQAIDAAASLVFTVLAGLFWLFPPTHALAGKILKGVGISLLLMFVVVPLLGWGIQHHADLGNLFPARGR